MVFRLRCRSPRASIAIYSFGRIRAGWRHQAIILRRLVKVCAFATSEDAADAAVSRTAKHVVVVMDAATQAAVATNVVRVLEMS